MGVLVWNSYNNNNITVRMFKLAAATCLLVLALGDLANGQLEVEVSSVGEKDRFFFCCPQTLRLCVNACAGQSCDKTCTGRCGFFGSTCGPFTCSAIASSTCTTTTTTTTTTSTAAPTTTP